MKNSIFLTVLLFTCSVATQAANINVNLDPRIELINTVWSLANDSNVVINDFTELDNYFEPFKNHKVMLDLKNNYPIVKIPKHIIPLLALQLEISGSGKLLFQPQSPTMERWVRNIFPGNSFDELLANLNDFYEVSSFPEYYNNLQNAKKEELGRINNHVAHDKEVQSVADFFELTNSNINFFVSYSTNDSLYGVPYITVDDIIKPMFVDQDMEMMEMFREIGLSPMLQPEGLIMGTKKRELGYSILVKESRPLSSALIDALVINALNKFPVPEPIEVVTITYLPQQSYPYGAHGISVFNFMSKWLSSLVAIELAQSEKEQLIEQAVNNGFPWQEAAIRRVNELKVTNGNNNSFYMYLPELYSFFYDYNK